MYRVAPLIFLVALVLVGGCRVEMHSSADGHISTLSEAIACQNSLTCVIDLNDANFDETFTAVANSGYFFVSWRKRDNALCGGSVEDCRVTTTVLGTNEQLSKLLQSDITFSLEPIFALGTCEDKSKSWEESVDGRLVRFESSEVVCPNYAGVSVPHGVARLWRDGQLIAETRWRIGGRHDAEFEWWPDGYIKARYRWDLDIRVGKQREYWEDGTLQREQNYLLGMPWGEEKTFNSNGSISSTSSFKFGKLQGLSRTFSGNGLLLEETYYINGKALGPYRIYDQNGSIVEEGNRPALEVDGGEIVFDNNLGVVWTRDANLFKTLCEAGSTIATSFKPVDADDVEAICAANGAMTWNDAKLWVSHLGNNRFGGYTDWRLPVVSPEAEGYDGIDDELSQLYYMTLDNPGSHYSKCSKYSDYPCLQNTGPFVNVQSDVYWTGTLHPVYEDAYFVSWGFGGRDSDNFENLFYVWPVTE